jgi:hypothetical protein
LRRRHYLRDFVDGFFGVIARRQFRFPGRGTTRQYGNYEDEPKGVKSLLHNAVLLLLNMLATGCILYILGTNTSVKQAVTIKKWSWCTKNLHFVFEGRGIPEIN